MKHIIIKYLQPPIKISMGKVKRINPTIPRFTRIYPHTKFKSWVEKSEPRFIRLTKILRSSWTFKFQILTLAWLFSSIPDFRWYLLTEMWNRAIFSNFQSIFSIEKLYLGYWVSNRIEFRPNILQLCYFSCHLHFDFSNSKRHEYSSNIYFDLSHEWQKQIDFSIMTIFIQFKRPIMTFEETNWRKLHYGVYFDIS